MITNTCTNLIISFALELLRSLDHSLFIVSFLIISVIFVGQIDTASHLIKEFIVFVIPLIIIILCYELFLATAVIVHENLE